METDMERAATTQQATDQEASMPTGRPPYAPSWVDLLTDWVRTLPGPSWLFYVLVGVVPIFIMALIGWIENNAWDIFGPLTIVVALTAGFALALVHYLDDVAARALAKFRPALDADRVEYEALRYQLTTMPAWPTLFASLLGIATSVVIVLFSNPNDLRQFGAFTSPSLAFTVVQVATFLFLWVVQAALIYHTVRQLRLVSHIYANYTKINLFQLQPVYSFSMLTSRTALGLIVLVYAWVGTEPRTADTPLGLASALFFLTIAAVVFVWPLLGMHGMLSDEKARLQAEAGQHLEVAVAELHRRTEAGDYSDMVNIQNAIDGLVKERGALEKISTWPWEPETVRLVVTALLLPVVLWFVTRVLERLGF
jgi:hypothetical protein